MHYKLSKINLQNVLIKNRENVATFLKFSVKILMYLNKVSFIIEASKPEQRKSSLIYSFNSLQPLLT